MPENELTYEEKEFFETTNSAIIQFVKTGESMLEFPPMNSYYRRLVHKLGTLYNLESQSVGESEERYVCLVRTPSTRFPDESPEFSAIADKTNQEQPKPRFENNSRNGRNGNRNSSMSNGRRNEFVDLSKQIFTTKPGTLIVLRADGSFGIQREGDQPPVQERIIEEGEFRIIKNQIVCPSDENWSSS